MALASAPTTTKAQHPPVTRNARCSQYVNDGAARLFLAGWSRKLHYVGAGDEHLFWTIPSEAGDQSYTLDYNVRTDEVRCSCEAGKHSVPCKHFRFLQLVQGWEQQAARPAPVIISQTTRGQLFRAAR